LIAAIDRFHRERQSSVHDRVFCGRRQKIISYGTEVILVGDQSRVAPHKGMQGSVAAVIGVSVHAPASGEISQTKEIGLLCGLPSTTIGLNYRFWKPAFQKT
jgi:hypothetical protein